MQESWVVMLRSVKILHKQTDMFYKDEYYSELVRLEQQTDGWYRNYKQQTDDAKITSNIQTDGTETASNKQTDMFY